MEMYYITFRSVTPAQHGQRTLRGAGIGCNLQRTPKWMEQQGCGYCLRVRAVDAVSAVEILRKNQLPFRKVYAITDGSAEERQL